MPTSNSRAGAATFAGSFASLPGNIKGLVSFSHFRSLSLREVELILARRDIAEGIAPQ
jgi:hypothetical protein